MSEVIALRQWKTDVATLLVFQWAVLLIMCGVWALWNTLASLNAFLAGLAVLIPNTALGAWVGIRLLLGNASGFGMLVGSLLKTGFTVIWIIVAFFSLQKLGWVWQGFFAGLVGMVFAPVLFGMLPSRLIAQRLS